MSQTLSRWQAILLALVVIGGLGLATAGLFAIGNKQGLWNQTFHVQVGFRQVRGVEVGTRVRVQGMDAGEIVAVQPPAGPGSDVVLKLRLNTRFRHLVRANATAQIIGEGMIGGKIVEIDPGSTNAEPIADNALIASKPTTELSEVLAKAEKLGEVLGEVQGLLQDVRSGEGTLGKLLKDDHAYKDLVQLIRQGKGTLESIQQDADALKDMPIVRSYVKDPRKVLLRPECECNRQSFAEAELFEPGRAVLTSQGKQELDKLVPWLQGLKHKGSEVVVVTAAAPGLESKVALTLSEKQSEAVCSYLINQHAVQKMGWFTSRSVTPVGLGTNPSPLQEKETVPAPRIEVLVFVPRT